MHVASVRESYRELAEKNDQLEAAFDRLKELDRLKSNFLATVSHELRTPLTSIIGYSEMLAGEIAGPLGDEQREFVDTIRKKGEHLLSLISNLLDVGRLEQGHLSLAREIVDARDVVEEVASTAAPSARKKGVRIVADIADDVPRLTGDPVRIRQILQNLVDNAIKFTPTQGTVTIGARAAELEPGDGNGLGAVLMAAPRPAIELFVRDTGVGIPTQHQARVFDAFFQVDSSSTREHGGAGLGLSIVKRLVDAHEGQVRVESEPGQGATFYVTIPDTAVESGG
jgi:signal transduction histidine kinase